MIERADDGVVESGAAARVDALESLFEFRDAARKVFVEVKVKIVVEIDYEGFVLRIAVLDEGESGFVNAGTLVAHTAAVVDHESHADGNILALEDGEFLLDFVFVDAEIVLGETLDEFAAVVQNRGVENHEVDIKLDAAAGLAGRLGFGGIRGRRGRRPILHRDLGKARRNG